MSEAEATSGESTVARRWWHRIPLLRVVILTIALLLIGEEFPFSYFPMYSSFDPQTDYYYVADAGGSPLACVAIFGTSTANVKKMYRARLRALLERRGAREADATLLEREKIGREMLVYLRGLGARSGRDVPKEAILLKRVVVERTPGNEIKHTETIIAQG